MVPTDRKYTREHDWVLIEDGVATLGITDHAQSELGDIVYVELPEVDSEINLGESYTTVESVKAASPVNSPVAGTVIEVNEELDAQPELLNEDASVSSSQRSKLPKSTKQACSPQKNTKSCLKRLNQPVPVATPPKPVLFGTVPR